MWHLWRLLLYCFGWQVQLSKLKTCFRSVTTELLVDRYVLTPGFRLWIVRVAMLSLSYTYQLVLECQTRGLVYSLVFSVWLVIE